MSDLVFAYAICCECQHVPHEFIGWKQTYHVLSKESEALQSAHGLGRGINVAEHNMRLASHLHRLERNNIEDDAIGSKQHVQVSLEVFFL